MSSEIRILRLPDVLEKVGLKQSTVYKYIRLGKFPKPIRLGSRATGWLESTIDKWILDTASANDDQRQAA